MPSWTMLQAELRAARLPILVWLAFSTPAISAGNIDLKLRETDGFWRIPCDIKGTEWIGIDGLAHKGRPSGSAKSSSIVALGCGSDSIELRTSPPVEGADEAIAKYPTPCSFVGFTAPSAPESLYDLMLFGNQALLPWVKIQTSGFAGYAPIPSLELRRTQSEPEPRFFRPTIVRAPFLKPMLGGPVATLSGDGARSFRVDHGAIESDTTFPDSIHGWNWSVVFDDKDGIRHRVDSRDLPNRRTAWNTAVQRKMSTLRFDDTYRREPRRVESLRSPRSKRTHLVLEVATLYGDGVWTDLWVIGPDTLFSRRIGGTDGEAGTERRSTWKVDSNQGRVTVTTNKKSRRIFVAR